MFWSWFIVITVVLWFGVEMKERADAQAGKLAQPAPSRWSRAVGMLVLSPVIAIFAFVVASCTSGSGGSATNTTASSFSHADALTMCQSAIRRVARDPDKAEIPYVENFGTGNEYYFAWGGSTKAIRMRNGLGLDVATSAACIVSKTSRQITLLTLDGSSIL